MVAQWVSKGALCFYLMQPGCLCHIKLKQAAQGDITHARSYTSGRDLEGTTQKSLNAQHNFEHNETYWKKYFTYCASEVEMS